MQNQNSQAIRRRQLYALPHYLKRKMETRRFTQTNIPRSHPSGMHGEARRSNHIQHRNNQYLIKVKIIHDITTTQIVELDCYVYFYILTSFNLFTDLHQAYQPSLVRIYEFHHLFEILPNVQYFRHMGSQTGQIFRNEGLSFFFIHVTP